MPITALRLSALSLCAALLLGAAAANAQPRPLPIEQSDLTIPAGYSRVLIEVQPGQLTSIALFGPRDALLHFDVQGVTAHDPLLEDALLPRVASFLVPEGTTRVVLSVEVAEETRLSRIHATPTTSLPAEKEQPLLIGLPSPGKRDDGYLLEQPSRYQFARPDVVRSLRDAFFDTRRRFRRDPIGVADISQWDGRRPALDIGQPHHISHEGGRDVDIALPSTIEPSLVRDHCTKEIAPDFQSAWCREGTVRELDALRLAFLLGRLVSTHSVDKIFIDQAFIAPIAEAAKRLLNPLSYPDWVVEQMQPEAGVLRHVAWHTDHVHVRFLGPKAEPGFSR